MTLLEAVSTPISELTAALAELKAGLAEHGGDSAADEAATRRACCRRWMRSALPPTRWKALWPTIFGRYPPIRRCSTSSDGLTDDVVECGGRLRRRHC